MQALRILFFVSDQLISDIRISPLLGPLCSSGRARVAWVDRDMNISGQRSDIYDVLIAHRNVGQPSDELAA